MCIRDRGSIAKHLGCDELLYYTFIIQSAGETIFKIGEHLAKLHGKMVDCFMRPIRIELLSSKMLISPDKLNNCVLRRETVTNRCYVNRQINVSLLSQISNCCRPVLT